MIYNTHRHNMFQLVVQINTLGGNTRTHKTESKDEGNGAKANETDSSRDQYVGLGSLLLNFLRV